ncbi:phage portal protein [Sunxiuqinia indica]|uniref:phage portal protein n=1 Tax=Sunxiuqinia indica TaxID=2692584 RepID=UPI00135CC29D|nr:phage portal protein [Sunxiuqinia indica]
MNIFASLLTGAYNWLQKGKNQVWRWGTELFSLPRNGVTGTPEKIATVFTCCRILSDNLSRMPLSVFLDQGNGRIEMTRHRLTFLLKYKPNNYQSAKTFWSTIEFHRSKYGNGLARVYKNQNTGYPTSMEIIHPSQFKEYFFENGILYYSIYNVGREIYEDIPATEILHFRNISEDGIIGFSPLVAIQRQTNINERATATMDNFYKNNAITPTVLETDMVGNLSGPAAGTLKEQKEQFQRENAGPENAGKWMHLPMGTKAKSIAMQFVDAQLIDTLRFTREDISSAYGVLLGMVDGSFEKMDVEQLTTLFKNNTMGPIVAEYMAEINSKLLTSQELTSGFSVMFDVLSLIGMDYATLVAGIKDQVVNGLMSPNEGAKKLGNKPIPGEWANKHYMQAQYIPLENYDKYNTLMKVDPTLKSKPNDNSK